MNEADKDMVVKNVRPRRLADGPKVGKRDKGIPSRSMRFKAVRARMEGNRLMPSLFFVGLALGLREGEAFGLRWSDVDLDKGILVVSKQIQRVKGGGFVFDDPKTEASKAPLEPRSGSGRDVEGAPAACAWRRNGSVAGTRGLIMISSFVAVGTPLDASNVRKVLPRGVRHGRRSPTPDP